VRAATLLSPVNVWNGIDDRARYGTASLDGRVRSAVAIEPTATNDEVSNYPFAGKNANAVPRYYQ
jgi:hypothetical protein